MLETRSAATIQNFFSVYRLKKQASLKQAIFTSDCPALLQAIDLRFQCMRAVAAAKFAISKPLEDREQIERVLHAVTELAKTKDIINLEAIKLIFQQHIELSTRIQSSYYDLVWKKSYIGEPNIQNLLNQAYIQLCNIVSVHHLPINAPQEKINYASSDVLFLVRDIIQYASRMIIEELAKLSEHHLAEEDAVKLIEKMLSSYMTPNTLTRSQDNVDLLMQGMMVFSG